MIDCLVTGAGRSGTSLVTGLLASAGYHTGSDHYLSSRAANPTGFFEDRAVNDVNDELLRPYRRTHRRWVLRRNWIPWRSTLTEPGWWTTRPPSAALEASTEVQERIKGLLARRPFAYKDPRFAFTLPAWRPFLPAGTRFICVFRDPGHTIDSTMREREETSLRWLPFGTQEAEALWIATYRSVLAMHGEWLFLHYDQCLDGSAVHRLSAFLQADVTDTLTDSRHSRATGQAITTPEALELYELLCRRAQPTGSV